jgi:hypothetical protein
MNDYRTYPHGQSAHERRETAAAEVEHHALTRAMLLMRLHTPPVEVVAFLKGAMAVADATRAGAVDPGEWSES